MHYILANNDVTAQLVTSSAFLQHARSVSAAFLLDFHVDKHAVANCSAKAWTASKASFLCLFSFLCLVQHAHIAAGDSPGPCTSC